ncbi:MAG TPA: DUF4255 domain-containing protein [Pyrinomonadaceae bacterium]|jgi:hypothetical protein
MSASSVISDVTETLEALLKNEQLPRDTFDVSLKSPADETVQPSMKPKVNLFLFRVMENAFAKNQEWQAVGTDTLNYPPLALNLFYVLTPYAENRLDEQRIFGEAMRILHDNAVVAGATLRGALENTSEELKIDMVPFTLENIAQIWSAMNQPYRLSVCYQVRMVLIDSRIARRITRVTESEQHLSQGT